MAARLDGAPGVLRSAGHSRARGKLAAEKPAVSTAGEADGPTVVAEAAAAIGEPAFGIVRQSGENVTSSVYLELLRLVTGRAVARLVQQNSHFLLLNCCWPTFSSSDKRIAQGHHGDL